MPNGSELFAKAGDALEETYPWICEMMDAPDFQLVNSSPPIDDAVYGCTTIDQTEDWYAEFEEWLLSTGYQEAHNWLTEIDDLTTRIANGVIAGPHHKVLEFYAFAARTFLERASAAVEEMKKAVTDAIFEAQKQLSSPSPSSETEQDEIMDDSFGDIPIATDMDIDVFQANPLLALPTFDTPPVSPVDIKPLLDIPRSGTPPSSLMDLSDSLDMPIFKLPGSIDSAWPSHIVEHQRYWNPDFPPRRTIVRVSAVPFGKKKAQKGANPPSTETSDAVQQVWNDEPRWPRASMGKEVMTGSSCYSDDSDDGRCCMCLRVYCECP